MKKYFFGWTNIKWNITEIRNIYSNKPSFFSKKRIESGLAFAIGQWGMIEYFTRKVDTMSSSDLLLWAGVEFTMAGYMISQIQKEKNPPTENVDETPEQLNS